MEPVCGVSVVTGAPPLLRTRVPIATLPNLFDKSHTAVLIDGLDKLTRLRSEIRTDEDLDECEALA
jgi:hypothetical protein